MPKSSWKKTFSFHLLASFSAFCQVGWRCGLDIDIHTCTYDIHVYVCIHIIYDISEQLHCLQSWKMRSSRAKRGFRGFSVHLPTFGDAHITLKPKPYIYICIYVICKHFTYSHHNSTTYRNTGKLQAGWTVKLRLVHEDAILTFPWLSKGKVMGANGKMLGRRKSGVATSNALHGVYQLRVLFGTWCRWEKMDEPLKKGLRFNFQAFLYSKLWAKQCATRQKVNSVENSEWVWIPTHLKRTVSKFPWPS